MVFLPSFTWCFYLHIRVTLCGEQDTTRYHTFDDLLTWFFYAHVDYSVYDRWPFCVTHLLASSSLCLHRHAPLHHSDPESLEGCVAQHMAEMKGRYLLIT